MGVKLILPKNPSTVSSRIRRRVFSAFFLVQPHLILPFVEKILNEGAIVQGERLNGIQMIFRFMRVHIPAHQAGRAPQCVGILTELLERYRLQGLREKTIYIVVNMSFNFSLLEGLQKYFEIGQLLYRQ